MEFLILDFEGHSNITSVLRYLRVFAFILDMATGRGTVTVIPSTTKLSIRGGGSFSAAPCISHGRD